VIGVQKPLRSRCNHYRGKIVFDAYLFVFSLYKKRVLDVCTLRSLQTAPRKTNGFAEGTSVSSWNDCTGAPTLNPRRPRPSSRPMIRNVITPWNPMTTTATTTTRRRPRAAPDSHRYCRAKRERRYGPVERVLSVLIKS